MILTQLFNSDTRLIKSTSSHSYLYHPQHAVGSQRSRMQQPTCTRLRVRSPQDAQVIFHAVAEGVLPMVTRRLDAEERRTIASGSVFVWEERGPNPEATGLGIERWTDGKRWGPSRVRDEFLFYQEKDPDPVDVEVNSDSDTTLGSGSRPRNNTRPEPARSPLVKQTYSVYVDTSRGRRKWHLIAYFTADTADDLRTVSEIPELANLEVPPGRYRSARHNPARNRAHREEQANQASTHREFAPYPSPTRSLNTVYPTGSHPLPGGNGPYGPAILEGTGQKLAPLVYLQNLPPPRRHPVDEEILMTLYPSLT
ncbi:Gti1/Pac2 family-domain-containing protein [Chiua virens]|nr:Gti1/Pac2 family-domain-containing protein [Chiua virens]